MLIALLLSAGITGLLAGVHVAFSIAVMPGLARAGDAAFAGGMRGINTAIRNPVFGALFLLSPIAAIVAAVLPPTEALRWVAAALAVAATAVTLLVNVPLNTALQESEDSDADARERFERPWNRAHALRTAALVLSFALSLVAVGV